MIDFNQNKDSGIQYSVTLAENCDIKSNYLTKKITNLITIQVIFKNLLKYEKYLKK